MDILDTGWVWLLAFAAAVGIYLVWFGLIEVGIAHAPLPLPVALVWFVVIFMPVLLVSVLAELTLIGGLGLLAWEAYTYSALGYWPWRSGFDVLGLLSVDATPTTGWAGFDRLVETVLSRPVVLTATIPGLYSIGSALTAYALYSRWRFEEA